MTSSSRYFIFPPLLLASTLSLGTMTANAAPCLPGAVNFFDTPFSSYKPQDVDHLAIPVEEGCSIYLSDNTWIASPEAFHIKKETVLKFGFLSSTEGEIQAIGLERAENLLTYPEGKRYFSLTGTQRNIFGSNDFTYNDLGIYQEFTIPLRKFIAEEGDSDEFHLMLVMDQDEYIGGDAYFDNIRFEQHPELPAPQNLTYNDGKITWSPVEGAVGYQAYVLLTDPCDIPGAPPGACYDPAIMQLGDTTSYDVSFFEDRSLTFKIAALNGIPDNQAPLNYGSIFVDPNPVATPAPVAALPEPDNLQHDENFHFTWSSVEGAEFYHIYIDLDEPICAQPPTPAPTPPSSQSMPSATNKTCRLPETTIVGGAPYRPSSIHDNKGYTFYVAAVKSGDDKFDRDVFNDHLNYASFYVEADSIITPTPVPIAALPAPENLQHDENFHFTWSPVEGAQAYHVYIELDESLCSPPPPILPAHTPSPAQTSDKTCLAPEARMIGGSALYRPSSIHDNKGYTFYVAAIPFGDEKFREHTFNDHLNYATFVVAPNE